MNLPVIPLHAGDLAEGGHELHLLVLLCGWLLTAAAWTMRDRLSAPGTVIAVLGSAVSGCVHLLVTPAHFDEAPAYGLFFLLLTVGQLAWAVLYLRRPDPRLLAAGAAASLVVVALWLETRLAGAGLGPLAPGREGFGSADVVCAVFELAIVGVAVAYAVRRVVRARVVVAVAALV